MTIGTYIDLAAEGAESEGVGEAAVAYLAGEGDAFTGAGLRPFVQEHNLGAVDHIRLNAADVDVPLDFANPHHIMIRRSPNLHPINYQSTAQTSQTRSRRNGFNGKIE